MRIILGLMLALLLLGCSSPKMQVMNDAQDPGKPTILVAVLNNSYTQFKQDMVSMVKADYGSSYNIEVMAVKTPKDLDGKKYEALIVMDMLRAWTLFNGGLKKFAAEADQSKTVYFVSSGDANWKWNKPNLQVVTGATVKTSVPNTYQKIKATLEPILN